MHTTLAATRRFFKGEYPKVQFVPGGNAEEVAEDRRGVAYVLSVLARGVDVIKLIDRDANSPEEIEDFRSQGIRVLSRRNLESYLFDDEVLRELARSGESRGKGGITHRQEDRNTPSTNRGCGR